MIDHGVHSVGGVPISAVDYEAATQRVLEAAKQKRPLAVSALAVHGVMTGVLDREHLSRLSKMDLLVPDGQPVRWALRLLHGIRLPDRVYGPELTLRVCQAAAAEGVLVYFYGSRPEVLKALETNLKKRFPDLIFAGLTPSRFRALSSEENVQALEEIRASGAGIVFVGLGCPRQEVWAYENTRDLAMPVLAVGAAFDFHAGLLSQAPKWMQDRGLEWFYRLTREPRRLWRRYVFLNPLFCLEIARQYFLGERDSRSTDTDPQRIRYG
ncbi:MAG: WecB/TagA/CpsF family glycosyltransferase [Roseibium sp.]|nr:WecB/TagA/CpsF family glycosyltransferase [Roseibium sp.]